MIELLDILFSQEESLGCLTYVCLSYYFFQFEQMHDIIIIIIITNADSTSDKTIDNAIKHKFKSPIGQTDTRSPTPSAS